MKIKINYKVKFEGEIAIDLTFVIALAQLIVSML